MAFYFAHGGLSGVANVLVDPETGAIIDVVVDLEIPSSRVAYSRFS